MSGATVHEFLAYWVAEGEVYLRSGDYEWMAGLVPGKHVLEIGCGAGFATQALLARGLAVLALDSLPECLDATRQRVDSPSLQLMIGDVMALTPAQQAQIVAFAPDTVVCWLMGAPAEVPGAAAGDGGRAVVAYREKTHRAVAELAASLPSVTALHLVDRTAIAWQAKDIGRDTLVNYHTTKTLLNLPLTAERRHALYRKLDTAGAALASRKMHPALKGAVPTLASLLVERKK